MFKFITSWFKKSKDHYDDNDDECEYEIENMFDEDEIRDWGYVIDFDKINVYAIEVRIDDGGVPVTVLSYIDEYNNFSEFTLYLSKQKHENLCLEYLKYKNRSVAIEKDQQFDLF